MKKSYNPFKMWGSWVGAGIGLLSIFISTSNIFFYILKSINPNIDFAVASPILIAFMSYVFPIILGFLIGWGIHSLIRRLK